MIEPTRGFCTSEYVHENLMVEPSDRRCRNRCRLSVKLWARPAFISNSNGLPDGDNFSTGLPVA